MVENPGGEGPQRFQQTTMALQVTGKNLDVGEALRTYVTERVEQAIDKYFGSGLGGHVRIEKEHGRFRTNCSIVLRSGLSLQAQGESPDPYAAADIALERLEKRLRRYKRRLKSRHGGGAPMPIFEERVDAAGGLQWEPEENGSQGETGAANPVIVAERGRLVRLSVSDAARELDVAEQPFLIFRNAATGRLNVVYRRSDGNIGWLDPDGADGQT